MYLHFSNMLEDALPKGEVHCILFNNAFGDEHEGIMDVCDLIDAMAIKDGIDYIQYENGRYGIVAYYNAHKTFAMFVDPAIKDLQELLKLHSDKHFHEVDKF